MPHVVTKSDLVQVAAKAGNVSKVAAGEAVNAVFEAIVSQRGEGQARHRGRLRHLPAAHAQGARRTQPGERQGDQDPREDHPGLRRRPGVQGGGRQRLARLRFLPQSLVFSYDCCSLQWTSRSSFRSTPTVCRTAGSAGSRPASTTRRTSSPGRWATRSSPTTAASAAAPASAPASPRTRSSPSRARRWPPRASTRCRRSTTASCSAATATCAPTAAASSATSA